MAFVCVLPLPLRAQEALSVPGFLPASVVAPSDASRPRPVVIALHGNFDRPEWMCAAISSVVAGRAFILCPRGVPRRDAPEDDPRFTHRPLRGLLREVDAARAALAAAYPGQLDDGPDVWLGFSLGAHRAAAVATSAPERTPLVLLIEGGDALFEHDAAERLAAHGGRVGVACALPGCERRGRRLAETLAAGSGAALVERIETCHWCIDVMRPAIARIFDWLVSSDPRFAP